jgi:hypothetical protein
MSTHRAHSGSARAANPRAAEFHSNAAGRGSDARTSIGRAAEAVFKGSDPAPDLAPNIAVLRLENNKLVQLEPTVLPPPNPKKQPAKDNAQSAKKDSHGFFGKVGAFFASIFH